MKSSKEIRQEFIQFFVDRGHVFVPSWPVIPMDDPTLLFTNAGMNQFKDIFLGKGERKYKRAVNSQRCIRVSGKHNDLEEVGHDTYHHTFFEMLGNWSFGDYYKEEAIRWAWELLTEVWKLPKDRLYATVYKDDDEAAEIWPRVTDLPAERVLRFGEKENFWEMADVGPCGPCSEIHIDLGEQFCNKKHDRSHQCRVNGDCARFIELWNLVFIQYHRDETGKLNPLPAKHVDTGMGFERIVSVLQGVYDNYKTDLFVPIIREIESITGVQYDKAGDKSPFHVIADHIRMLTFSIGDGGMPSNEGRGYVIRRILRRAARYARKLEMHEPFIYRLVPVVVEILGEAFPEITSRTEFIQRVIRTEEENFNKTLDRGLDIFSQIVKKVRSEGKVTIPGEDAFRLYDTYGFPLDLTRILAQEENMVVDEAGFDREMEKQRERARQAGKFDMEYDHEDQWNILHHGSHSHFVGYERLESKTRVMQFLEKDEQHMWIILEETPFYPEGGGQVGDTGVLIIDGKEFPVLDTFREGEAIIHVCRMPENRQIIHGETIARVAENVRVRTMYNHTATHLLHAALRRILGDHVQQAGSLVQPDRLRFDFTHFEKLTPEQIRQIEQLVNEKIRADYPLEIVWTSLDEAKKMGAMALFGEKYGEEVRVIIIDDYSRELCGGTHVSRTGQIGAFMIVEETSVAAGVRRIEAITGPAVIDYLQQSREMLKDLSVILNAAPTEVAEKVKQLQEEYRRLEKKLEEMEKKEILGNVDRYFQEAKKIHDILLISRIFGNVSVDLLKNLGDALRNRHRKFVAFLAVKNDEKVNFVVVLGDDVVKELGWKAGDLAKELAGILGGGGGGRPHMATAGGSRVDKLPEALQVLENKIVSLHP